MTPAQANFILAVLGLIVTINAVVLGYVLRVERRITRIETTCQIKTGCKEAIA